MYIVYVLHSEKLGGSNKVIPIIAINRECVSAFFSFDYRDLKRARAGVSGCRIEFFVSV